MKVLFLTPEYPHIKLGASGGIGTSIKNLAESLVELGVYVRVLVYGQSEDCEWEERGLIIESIKNIHFKGLSWYFTRKKIEHRINRLVKENNVDIVEAPDWTGITSFIQPKCPVVIRMNGSDTYFCHLEQRPVKFWNRYHEKRALHKATGLLAVSQFTANVTRKLFQLQVPIAIIPNGINCEYFKSNQTRVSQQKEILYFGTLIRKKGALELPHIFNQVVQSHPDAVLRLIGKDSGDIRTGATSTWELMQQLFSPEARQQTFYEGSLPYEQMREQIDLATVCVFPTFAEALPVSWLEAMAMEKAIVASNIGWANELIENGKSGYLVHPTDHWEYARRIGDLLSDASLNKKIGQKALERVQTVFESRIIAQQSMDYYTQLRHDT